MDDLRALAANPPLRICLHCKWYTLKRHWCCKDRIRPIRKANSPGCLRWAASDDAQRAWLRKPANETERWAQERIRAMFRKAAYAGGEQCR